MKRKRKSYKNTYYNITINNNYYNVEKNTQETVKSIFVCKFVSVKM